MRTTITLNLKKALMINLSTITNITNIEQLSQHYELIRKYAHQMNPLIKEQMDDVVQDAFIKLSDIFLKYPGKEIDGGYVALTLSSILKNQQKAYTNKMDFGNDNYEATIPDTPDNYEEILQHKLEEEYKYIQYEDKKKLLSWYERKILDYSLMMSLSELSRHTGISYKSLSWSLKKIKEKLKNNDTINQ